MKISEQVRRLEDTIESLRAENKKLREGKQKDFMITYKWQVTELPTEWNKEWDMYTISYKDRITDKIITDKWVRYKNKWRNPIDVEHMVEDERDEIIDHQKRDMVKLRKEIDKLKEELWARVEQVENLQDTLKKITKENLKLQDRLEKCENLNRKCTEKYGEEELHPYEKSIADDIDFVNDIKKLYWSIFKR